MLVDGSHAVLPGSYLLPVACPSNIENLHRTKKEAMSIAALSDRRLSLFAPIWRRSVSDYSPFLSLTAIHGGDFCSVWERKGFKCERHQKRAAYKAGRSITLFRQVVSKQPVAVKSRFLYCNKRLLAYCLLLVYNEKKRVILWKQKM